MPKRNTTYGLVILLVAVLLVSAAVRLINLGYPSLWVDEIAEAWLRDIPWSGVHLVVLKNNVLASPLDYYVAKAIHTATDDDFWLRLPSVLWGIGSVCLLFRFAAKEGFPWSGLIAALFLALSPFHIRYSRQLRYYSPLVFFTLLVAATYLRTLRENTRGNWFRFVLAGLVGLYFHLFVTFALLAVFVWEATGLARLWKNTRKIPDRFRPFLVSNVVVGLGFAPFFIAMVTVGHPFFPHTRELQPVQDAKVMLSHLAGSAYEDNANVNWQFYLASLIALVGMVEISRRQPRLWILGIPVIGLLASYPGTRHYWFAPKFGIYLLPFFALAVGFGIVGTVERLGRRIHGLRARTICSVAIAAVLMGAAIAYPTKLTLRLLRLGDPNQWIDWKRLAEFLERNGENGALIVRDLPQGGVLSLQYYLSARQVILQRDEPLGIAEYDSVWVTPLTSGVALETMVNPSGFQVVHLSFNHAIPVYYLEKSKSFDLLRFLAPLQPVASGVLLSSIMRAWLKGDQAEVGFSLAREWIRRLPPGERSWLLSEFGVALRDRAFNSSSPFREYLMRESAGHLKAAVRIRPDWIYTYAYLGSVYNSLGQWSETLRLEKKVFGIPAESYYWYAQNFAIAHLEMGNIAGAISTVRRALDAETDPKLRDRLAEQLAKLEARAAEQ